MTHKKIIIIICVAAGMIFIPFASCHRNSNDEDNQDDNYRCYAEQWAPDTSYGYAYGHDCSPYAGEHFTIYSDGSSTEAKQQLAQLAEEILEELVKDFLLQDITADLRFTPGYTYYIYAIKHLQNIGAMGFRNGFFMTAVDSAVSPGFYQNNPTDYRYVVKHEMTHVFQFTLTDCPSNAACPFWLGVWFREGQAINIGGGGERRRVSTLAEFNDWVSDSAHANPISIHRWTDFPDENIGGQYYPMFALAYTYLVDQNHGHGATISDMKDLFRLMSEGYKFKEAFEMILNMTVDNYEENFYTLMEEYLSKTEQGTKNCLTEKMDYFKKLQ